MKWHPTSEDTRYLQLIISMCYDSNQCKGVDSIETFFTNLLAIMETWDADVLAKVQKTIGLMSEPEEPVLTGEMYKDGDKWVIADANGFVLGTYDNPLEAFRAQQKYSKQQEISTVPKYLCPFCSESLPDSPQLLEHYLTKHEKDILGRDFIVKHEKEILERLGFTVDSTPPRKIGFIGDVEKGPPSEAKVLHTPEEAKEAIQTTSEQEIAPVQKYLCPFCPEDLPGSPQLLKHFILKHDFEVRERLGLHVNHSCKHLMCCHDSSQVRGNCPAPCEHRKELKK